MDWVRPGRGAWSGFAVAPSARKSLEDAPTWNLQGNVVATVWMAPVGPFTAP